jgi:hypothetical protein
MFRKPQLTDARRDRDYIGDNRGTQFVPAVRDWLAFAAIGKRSPGCRGMFRVDFRNGFLRLRWAKPQARLGALLLVDFDRPVRVLREQLRIEQR